MISKITTINFQLLNMILKGELIYLMNSIIIMTMIVKVGSITKNRMPKTKSKSKRTSAL